MFCFPQSQCYLKVTIIQGGHQLQGDLLDQTSEKFKSSEYYFIGRMQLKVISALVQKKVT